jgi:hypothetical protein
VVDFPRIHRGERKTGINNKGAKGRSSEARSFRTGIKGEDEDDARMGQQLVMKGHNSVWQGAGHDDSLAAVGGFSFAPPALNCGRLAAVENEH